MKEQASTTEDHEAEIKGYEEAIQEAENANKAKDFEIQSLKTSIETKTTEFQQLESKISQMQAPQAPPDMGAAAAMFVASETTAANTGLKEELDQLQGGGPTYPPGMC